MGLKRFEFDYSTMQRVKVNDYCEFPEVIDFKPWTKEGIEEAEGGQDLQEVAESLGGQPKEFEPTQESNFPISKVQSSTDGNKKRRVRSSIKERNDKLIESVVQRGTLNLSEVYSEMNMTDEDDEARRKITSAKVMTEGQKT